MANEGGSGSDHSRHAVNPFAIKDRCRKNLSRYTLRAFSAIPAIADPLVLDIGCGSGVPTLALMEACQGRFCAVDPDPSCLEWLRQKVDELNYSGRIELIRASIFDLPAFPERFDVILAEGVLHIVGFERGLLALNALLCDGGHMIIHDQVDRGVEKKAFFTQIGLLLVESFSLTEKVWWSEYYACLEQAIRKTGCERLLKREVGEINEIKSSPGKFRSIYYILCKKNAVDKA
jgi:ubiquinone/menaquinone biosynthesis C-methylase UbiE